MNKNEFLSTYKAYGDDMIIELIDTFLQDYPEKLSVLNDAIKNKDFETINRYSHSLKGSLGIFSADEARDAAYRLELAGKNNDDSNLNELYAQFDQHLNHLNQELINIKNELSS
ncbi:MAG: Hpt domain-containing protein [Bacteroidales bacterium]|nr:Hpt domain-containing protein [Bacteroidales bacterium]MCF8327536.1 Hpt domain-containing protein [Bacteroidales bacterium]